MTVMSYIAYPSELGKKQLINDLKLIPEVDIEESSNNEILVIVITFESKQQEEEIQNKLSALKSLQCLALVYAANESDLINSTINK
jgi:nitrate reductase NapAB chaperone NapD